MSPLFNRLKVGVEVGVGVERGIGSPGFLLVRLPNNFRFLDSGDIIDPPGVIGDVGENTDPRLATLVRLVGLPLLGLLPRIRKSSPLIRNPESGLPAAESGLTCMECMLLGVALLLLALWLRDRPPLFGLAALTKLLPLR
jgi:hypothetical protein